MYTKENLSSIVKDYRKLHSITQKKFAEKAGISLRTLINLEKQKTVDIETVEKALSTAERQLWIAKV